MQEKRDEFDRFYCVPQIQRPVTGHEPTIFISQEAEDLLDRHHDRLKRMLEGIDNG
jgi:hypothetical protein